MVVGIVVTEVVVDVEIVALEVEIETEELVVIIEVLIEENDCDDTLEVN